MRQYTLGLFFLPFLLVCGGQTESKGESSESSTQVDAARSSPSEAQGQARQTTHLEASTASERGIAHTVRFVRKAEPRERAFDLLVPQGWLVEGGIVRIDPTAQGGPAQSIEAKLDFALKKDQMGSVMMKWVPELMYIDMRFSPAGQMGMFPQGSNYAGMTVWPKLSALEFLSRVVFPKARPHAQTVQVVEQRALPKVAKQFQDAQRAMMPGLALSYDVAIMTVSYREGGTQYRETFFTGIEDYGYLIPGGWKNKSTFFARAPADEFVQWEPVAGIILRSVRLNPKWVTGEIRGQITRGQIAADVIRDINRIGQEIADHQTKTNAEINNDTFLTLTEQEEYVNPFTNEVETGSNQWENRWTNPGGDVIYTNDEHYDPNVDVNLNRSDFKRTPVRPRFPQ